MGNKKLNRDLALKVLAEVGAVKDALEEILDSFVIVYQPKDVEARIGDTVTFKCVALNAVSYVWQYSTNQGETWRSSSTNTQPILSYELTSDNSNRWRRCKVTGPDNAELISDVAKIILIEEGT